MTPPGAGAGAGAGAETETGKDAGETGGGAGRFADRAVWLAGLAGWYLGWSPEAFWRATPAEMETVVRAMVGVAADGPVGPAPPTRADLGRLQEMFPDG